MATRNCEALQNACRSRTISATLGANLERSFLTKFAIASFFPLHLSIFSERRIVVAKLHETRLVLRIKDSVLMAPPNFSRTAQ